MIHRLSSRLPGSAIRKDPAMRPDAKRAPKRSRFAFVQSLERGLAVIKSFDEAHPEQTLTDVAKSTGLDRSAARRFLLTLEALGYVEHDGKLFRLRPQTLQLGYAYLASLPWWRSAQRVSEKLTDKIGVSTAVGVLDQYDVVYVAYASARRFPHLLNRSVGTHLPAITSAVGRVMIAGLPPEVSRGWLAKAKIERYTSLTRTNRAEIETILEDVRSRGFSIVDQELEVGLRSIGVPIRDKGGAVVAGLSVSIIEPQITHEAMIKRYLRPLQDAAFEITSALPT
jgi:IclR family transcriptional regulator, pca regulon regulatory protein